MLKIEMQRQGEWLFRRRSYVPIVLLPAALAVVSSHTRYLADSYLIDQLYYAACLLVALLGLVIRALAIGYAQADSSGRNTKEQIADHLNVTGMYSVCRHPLYLGNIVMALGLLLATRSPLLTLAGLGGYLLFYERIMAAEENFLEQKFGDTFRAWAARVPALLPRSGWVSPQRPFSLRAAIKGEIYGWTALVTVMWILRTADSFFIERRWRWDPIWLSLVAVSVALFVVLRHIRKHTTFFEDSNRRETSVLPRARR